jgi:hypothetical protein
MADIDHSAEIDEITEVLQSGVQEDETDGQRTRYDTESLRRERRRLELQDTQRKAQKPVASRIHLGGF